MRPKAKAASKTTPLRMLAYSARTAGSQLCCVLLTLAVLALPLAGVKPQRGAILLPLATHLVPLDRSVQQPAGTNSQVPSLLGPGRLVLGPPTSPSVTLNLYDQRRFRFTSSDFCDQGVIERPTGRSPPSA